MDGTYRYAGTGPYDGHEYMLRKQISRRRRSSSLLFVGVEGVEELVAAPTKEARTMNNSNYLGLLNNQSYVIEQVSS